MIEAALMCLAMNVFYEARGEPVEGQKAVALVTINRAEKKASNICKVVYAPKQFSWTAHGRGVPHSRNPAWQKAKKIAAKVMGRHVHDITWGATHFHAVSVSPKWRYRMVPTIIIGNHIFYRPKVSHG